MRVTRKPFKLDQLGSVGRGRSRHRPRNDPSLYEGDYPFFQTGDIKAAELYLHNYSQTYNDKGLAQSKLWQPGTVCITIAANIADSAILSVPGCFPDSVVGFLPHPDKSDGTFIKYYIDTIKLQMQSASRGTTQDNLSLDKLLTFDFVVPDVDNQRRIASILSAYDDLIENNTRRIAVLEEMARRLYDEWFVHFRFPGHEQVRMVESELGLIPEGWEVGRLGDVAKIQWGDTSLTKAAYTPEGYTAYSASGPDGLLGHFQRNGLGIVISAIGAQCGKTWFARGQWGCIKNTLSLWSANEEIVSNEFLFLQCNGESYWPRRGAAQPFISLGDARGCAVFLPSIIRMKNFTSIVSPMLSLISSLNRKNANLRAQRDLLLPKLISGEIEVSAFAEAEAVAA